MLGTHVQVLFWVRYGHLSILEGLFLQPRQGVQIPISLCYRGCSTPMVLLCIEYIPSGNIITEKSLFSTGDSRYIFNLFCFDVLIAMFTGSRPAVSYSPGSVEDLARQQVSCVPVSCFCFWEIVEQRYFEKNGTKSAAQKKLQKLPILKGKESRLNQPICFCAIVYFQLASRLRWENFLRQ